MKRILASVFLIALTFGLLMGINIPLTASAADKPVLTIYNWADYIDLEVIDEFEEANNVDVVYSTFDTNEQMLGTINIDTSSAIDLICPSDYAIERMLANDMIFEIDISQITNYTNVNSSIMDKIDEEFGDLASNKKMSDYFVPYFYGTVGILYNTKYVEKSVAEEAGYGLLWNTPNISALNGKILMKDSVREAYLAGLLYLKETNRLPEKYEAMLISELINTINDELLGLVETEFKEQKKILSEYEVDTGKNYMVEESSYVELAWSGDALFAMEENEDLDFFVPSVGGNIWFDGWVIPKTSNNKDLAMKFIDFLLRPDIAMRNSMEVGYTSAVKEESIRASADAIAIIEDGGFDLDEFFDDETRYPDLENTSLVLMRDFDETKLVTMWERVKAPDSVTSQNLIIYYILIPIGAVILIGLVVFLILKNKKQRKVVESE
ncbi:MAG: ABC transporter substrate-binding protein [Christensenellaceae bacterium]|jgi:spermidine/putrescine transport system substrate-binding protein|nr:ABC transporter substrate-binding protein [Christensenellaceae bacterium]